LVAEVERRGHVAGVGVDPGDAVALAQIVAGCDPQAVAGADEQWSRGSADGIRGTTRPSAIRMIAPGRF
jgi:hypothetical protein